MKIPALGPAVPLRKIQAQMVDAPEGFSLRQWTCVFTVSAVDDVAHALPAIFAAAVSEYRSAYRQEPRLRILVDNQPYILYRGIVSREHVELVPNVTSVAVEGVAEFTEFEQFLKDTAKTVDSWPKWKRELLRATLPDGND